MIRNFTQVIPSLFILFVLAFSTQAYSQDSGKLIRGKVLDSETKEPIIGTTVIEKDKDNRTITGVATDIDGSFAIRVKDLSHQLEISSIGYRSKIITLNENVNNIEILLDASLEQMDEVIVTAEKVRETGLLDIAERNRTTSVVTIDASKVEDMQAASIDEALQGRMPGVDISATSGDPGAGMQIRIRGTSSINGSSDPLVVVDGMPYETSVPQDFNFGTADQEDYAALLNIAPSDIESISVLKDAAATAMWGARAASGVLMITTKRGAVGPPTIGYTFKGSVAALPETIPMLNGDQYSQLIPEEFMNRNGTPLNTLYVKEFQYDPQEVYWYKNYSNNTDWIDAISQTGLIQDHNLSLQGGGKKARYYTSLGYYNSRGVTIGTGLDRINARLNLDYIVSDRIKFRADISYTHSKTERNYVNGTSNSADGIRNVAYVKMPNMSIYEYDEYGHLTPNYFSPVSNIQGSYSRTYNPVAMAEFAENTQLGERIVPHFNVNFKLIPSFLTTTFDLQFDINNTKLNAFLPQNATGRPFTETVVNRATDADVDAFNLITKTNFIFTPTLDEKQSLQGIISLQTNDYSYVSHQVLTSNTASSLLTDPSVPSRTQNDDLSLYTNNSKSRNVAALANVQYGLLDRYIINVGLRADGSSKFGPENRYGLFPSVSTRWRISGEKFMKNFDYVNDLSLRASYGKAGRAPRYDYRYFNVYGNFQAEYLGMSGVYPSNIQLSNLRWETLTGRDLGLNLRMFDERLMLDVDFYKNTTDDLLFENLDITSISGYNSIDMNVGKLDNQGWEVGLYTTPYKSPNIQVDFNFNISRNENVIREISEYFPSEKGNVDRNGEFKRFLQVDNPFGSFYGYRYKGVYKDKEATQAVDADGDVITGPNGQVVYMRFNYPNTDYIFQPGDAMYEDINHDGNIDSRDVVYLGNSNPKYTGGFGPTVTINNQWKFIAFFNYRLNYDIINGTDMLTTNMYGWDNQSMATLSRWRNPGDETDIPRAVYGAGYNWLGSDRYVEDASFLRFRSATISYSFADRVLENLNLKDLRVYLTADNIITFTSYRGQDPEVSMRGGDPFGIAIDYSRTPPTRRFTLGISTRF
ncbi:SusC/RagA family TonB-linked outer membrane protein [Christiangramia fulva]|uniref:SusC/RagA family TonB-linked outer membrane protein n=1 Tax=Christiangramia fulva TaxID=2126553 RepID=A0A2R3ZAX9_9FLAO|nr:SusC/RagA family TonB-linked outer membrane protein [Christiangramia fulva]AVR47417.1 SusC/RagA family TonB-linked outer membrane protein [Christiangramia fulva]